jgi:hypothetical protein
MLALVLSTMASAQTTFREDLLHGRNAFVLDNGRIRVSVLRGGSHIGAMRFVSG